MDFRIDVLFYFLSSTGATLCGIMYWMSVQNMGDRRYRLLQVGILSIFLTPVGAWVITSFVRMADLSRKSKESEP